MTETKNGWQPAIIVTAHGALPAAARVNGQRVYVRPAVASLGNLESNRQRGCDATAEEYVQIHPDDVARLRPDAPPQALGNCVVCKHEIQMD